MSDVCILFRLQNCIYVFLLLVFWKCAYGLNRIPGINLQVDSAAFYSSYKGTRTLNGRPANNPTNFDSTDPSFLEGTLSSQENIQVVTNARLTFLHSNRIFLGLVGSFQYNFVSEADLQAQGQYFPGRMIFAGLTMGIKFSHIHLLIDVFPFVSSTIQRYIVTSGTPLDDERADYPVTYFGTAGVQANLSYDLELTDNISLSIDVGYRAVHMESKELDSGNGPNQVTVTSSSNWPTGGLSLSYTMDSLPCF